MLDITNTYNMMKIKQCIVLMVCFCLMATTGLWAQSNNQGSEYDYIYQIEVATVSNLKSVETHWGKYKDLSDLGTFSPFCIAQDAPELPNKNRILLGYYIGKSTANRILAEVKKRGYSSAKIRSDGGFQLGHSTGKHVKYGLQAGAFANLSQVNVKQYPKQDEGTEVYIQYKNASYKIFIGLHSGESLEFVKADVMPWYAKKGVKVFVQKFR
jgi:hypothetical protein